MTTQNQVIIFCVLGFIAIPLGVFVGIKTINKIWTPTVNVLQSNRGEIELTDYIQSSQAHHSWDVESVGYIQPTQPLHVHFTRDFVNPVYERISSAPTYYSGTNPPSFNFGANHSMAAPSYHTLDRNIINCCLENENIIQNFIIWLIIFLVIILVISWFIYKNLSYSIILGSLIPFSSFEIDFRDAFKWTLKRKKLYPQISYLKIQKLTKELIDLLNSLAENENFSMGISYIPSYQDWKEKGIIPIYLQDPIIVNKESDPFLITRFIMETLNNKGLISSDRIFDDDFINLIDPVILTVVVPIDVEI